MPQVMIHGPSPKNRISRLQQGSWDTDIREVDGVTAVTSRIDDDLTYSAAVTGGTVASVKAALAESTPSDWTLSVL